MELSNAIRECFQEGSQFFQKENQKFKREGKSVLGTTQRKTKSLLTQTKTLERKALEGTQKAERMLKTLYEEGLGDMKQTAEADGIPETENRFIHDAQNLKSNFQNGKWLTTPFQTYSMVKSLEGEAYSAAGQSLQFDLDILDQEARKGTDKIVDLFEKTPPGNSSVGSFLGDLVKSKAHFDAGAASALLDFFPGLLKQKGQELQEDFDPEVQAKTIQGYGNLLAHPLKLAKNLWSNETQAIEKDLDHVAGRVTGSLLPFFFSDGLSGLTKAEQEAATASEILNKISRAADLEDEAAIEFPEFIQDHAPIRKLLADPDAEIVEREPIGGGINTTEKVTLSNGATAVWKPSEGEWPNAIHKTIPVGMQMPREEAASLVADYLGIKAPAAVYRNLDGTKGALIEYFEGSFTARKLSVTGDDILVRNPKAYEKLSVFDNVIGNMDRHIQNWMVDEAGHVIPIDHGLSFPEENLPEWGSFDFGRSVSLSEASTARLQNLLANKENLDAKIIPLIGEKATNAMWERVQRMLEKGKTGCWWQVEKTKIKK